MPTASSKIRPRCIVHVDLDCFYVQVERRLNQALKDMPCAVVQYNKWKGGGIIALSYEAKAAGVTRSMRGQEAKKLCPNIQLVTVPVMNKKADLTKYRQAGGEVFSICGKHEGAICQRTSIDEAYLDITEAATRLLQTLVKKPFAESLSEDAKKTFIVGLDKADETCATEGKCPLEAFFERCGGTVVGDDIHPEALLVAGAMEIARLRRKVFEETGFTLSAGISSNKILAKLISGTHKPNKQTVLPIREVPSLLARLPLRDLNGTCM